MTAILAILSGVGSALSAVVSAVFTIAAKVPWQVWAVIGLIVLGMWLGSGKGCREFCCARAPRPPRPPRLREYTVLEVPTATTLTVAYGLREKKQATVSLYGIEVPTQIANCSQIETRRLVGEKVELAEPKLVTGDYACPECEAVRPPPSIALAYCGEGCVQERLLAKGLARDTSKRADWVAAEKAARKAKLGFWEK